jgi:hypothetical protein
MYPEPECKWCGKGVTWPYPGIEPPYPFVQPRAQPLYEEEEEEEEREVDSSERHYGWGEQNILSVLKVPRHCPFVLLVSVSF